MIALLPSCFFSIPVTGVAFVPAGLPIRHSCGIIRKTPGNRRGGDILRIVILEDDAVQAGQINGYLVQYQQQHDGFQYTAKTYSTGRRLLEEYSPDTDLLLLDIQLPDMLGIDVARQIRQKDSQVMIIFVTNLAQYAIEGYSVQAFDYVLKPINAFSFGKKLDRAIRVLSHVENDLKMEIKSKNGSRWIAADAVAYIEVRSHEVCIHTGQETIRQWGTLAQYETLLKPLHFIRCNASFLVNPKYVRTVVRDQAEVAGDLLPISRTFRKDFLNTLAQYKGGTL